PADWDEVLDWQDLQLHLANDTDLLRELVSLFEAECPKLLADIRAGIAAGEGPRGRLACQALQGGGSNFGARAGIKTAQAVELLARGGDLASCSSNLAVLEEAAVRLLGVLAELQEHKPVA